MTSIELIDQLGQLVQLKKKPERIISLVPSITEYLFYLGLENSIHGITTFCTEPKEKVSRYLKVGGTKTFDVDQILKSKCDLVIANKEENVEEKIELIKQSIPCYVSDVNTLEDSFKMMIDIGLMSQKVGKSEELVHKISSSFKSIDKKKKPKKIVYLIWQNPIMIAGKNTFISSMISNCGHQNNGDLLGNRYPTVTVEEIKSLQPDIVLLSSEPYRFKKDHVKEWKELIPLSTVILADATYFSWYGNRLMHSAKYITELLNNAE